MSKTEAAYLILKSAKKPMHIKEIIRVALAKKMIETEGLTPASTLSADLYSENKRRKRQGKNPRFVKVDSGTWTLAEYN